MAKFRSLEVTTRRGSELSINKVPIPETGYFKFNSSTSGGFNGISASQFFIDANIEHVPITVSNIKLLTNKGDLLTSELSKTVILNNIAKANYVLATVSAASVEPSNRQGIKWKPNTINKNIILYDTRNGPQTFYLPAGVNGESKYLQLLTDNSHPATIFMAPAGSITLIPGNSTAILIYDKYWKSSITFPSIKTIDMQIHLSNIPNNIFFGVSSKISADGSVIVSSGPAYDTGSGPVGGIWTFIKNNNGYIQSPTILIDNTASLTNFGAILELSGNGKTLVVFNDLVFSNIYVYRYINNNWMNKIDISVMAGIISLAINYNGTVIIVGFESANSNSGKVYKFTYNGNNWVDTIIPTSLILASGDKLGTSVAITPDGSTVVAGIPGRGSAIVFDLINNTEILLESTVGGSIPPTANAGQVVAISADGNTIAITSTTSTTPEGTNGSILVFEKNITWTLQKQIIPNGLCGWSLAISASGNTIVSGHPDDNSNGIVWICNRVNNSWNVNSVTDSVNSGFGFSVALSLSGAIMIVGSPYAENKIQSFV